MSCATRSCLVDFVESIEYVKQVFFRYSDAVISDNESILREDDIDNSTLLGEFLCIGDDIAHCREEEFWIDDASDLCFLMPDDPQIIISDMRLEELHDISFFSRLHIIAGEEEEGIDDIREFTQYPFCLGYTIECMLGFLSNIERTHDFEEFILDLMSDIIGELFESICFLVHASKKFFEGASEDDDVIFDIAIDADMMLTHAIREREFTSGSIHILDGTEDIS